MKNVTIERMLVLSTAHVTKQTAAMLDERMLAEREGHYAYAPAFSRDEGWVFHTSQLEGDWPDDLMECLKLASKLECEWLMLDRDADAISDLPSYDW